MILVTVLQESETEITWPNVISTKYQDQEPPLHLLYLCSLPRNWTWLSPPGALYAMVRHYCSNQILFRIFTRSNASITITLFTSHPHLSIFVLWKFSRHEKYVNFEGVVGGFAKKVFLLFCTFPFPLIAPHMHSATSVFAVFLYPYHHHVILSICDNITAAKV